jgi:hypothetical protein
MSELIVDPVPSAGDLRRSLSPGKADEYGSFDGTTLAVDDAATAKTLVETYPNVRWADDAPDTAVDTTVPRGEVDADGSTYHCGVNDCSREVEGPTDTCWQHDES